MGEARRISFKVYEKDQEEIEQAAIRVALGWCYEVMATGEATP